MFVLWYSRDITVVKVLVGYRTGNRSAGNQAYGNSGSNSGWVHIAVILIDIGLKRTWYFILSKIIEENMVQVIAEAHHIIHIHELADAMAPEGLLKDLSGNIINNRRNPFLHTSYTIIAKIIATIDKILYKKCIDMYY